MGDHVGMDDKRLFELLLELKAPWSVRDVKVDRQAGRVDVTLGHALGGALLCPHCEERCPLHDHAPKRQWRHMDTMQHHTYLHVAPPRVRCKEHGVKTARLPWAGPRSRFTEMFEMKVIDTLEDLQNITSACKVLDVSWDEVFGVMNRAVRRGLARRDVGTLKHIGVDEKAWKKGHTYVTVLADLEKKAVVDIEKGRTTQSLDALYCALPKGSLDNVAAIAMDMWAAFLKSTLEHIPGASDKIVHDRFHCVQMLLKALNKVRAKEAKQLNKREDLRLVSAKYAVGKNPGNLTDKQRAKLDTILESDLETGRAWALKENGRRLWEAQSLEEAQSKFDHWYAQVESSGIGPMIEVARAFKMRSKQILNWFKHMVSTGIVEALNGQIMTIKRRARGHRNFDNLRTAILFFLGKLDLTLTQHDTAAC